MIFGIIGFALTALVVTLILVWPGAKPQASCNSEQEIPTIEIGRFQAIIVHPGDELKIVGADGTTICVYGRE
jgi:hypothetical protein